MIPSATNQERVNQSERPPARRSFCRRFTTSCGVWRLSNSRAKPQAKPCSPPLWSTKRGCDSSGGMIASGPSEFNSYVPASNSCFLDESEHSIDDGVFDYQVGNDWMKGPWGWIDLPGERHGRGANLSFLDGHVAGHRWLYTPKHMLAYGAATEISCGYWIGRTAVRSVRKSSASPSPDSVRGSRWDVPAKACQQRMLTSAP